jgi:hypothetical protein
LFGGVWTREADVYAMCGSEGVDFAVIELTTIVALYGRKRQIKLSMGKCAKRSKRQTFGVEEQSIENE